jgi:inner membrane protein
MMGVTHLLISSITTSAVLGSADPAVITVGAIASLCPDVDISISPAGRVFPWISRYLEGRFPIRFG